MSRRFRKGTILPVTALALAVGAVASVAQTVAPVAGASDVAPPPAVMPAGQMGAPIPLTPPDDALPAWLTLPVENAPAENVPVATAQPVSGTPAPRPTSAGSISVDLAPAVSSQGPAIPPAHVPAPPADPSPAVPPADADQAAPAAGELPPPVADTPPMPSPTFGSIVDPVLQGTLEQWQRDHLLYSAALRATQVKEQLCALDQAPDTLCRQRRAPIVAVEHAPADTTPESSAEPTPTRERAAPYRVVSVAGTGADIVVTLLNPDVLVTRTVRPGGWIDQDYKLASADYHTVVIKSRKRTYRLPVAAGTSWGGGS